MYEKKKHNIKIWILAIIAMFVGFNTSRLTSVFISSYFPVRAQPGDLLFDLLPYHIYLEYLTDVIFGALVITAIAYVIKKVPKEFVYHFMLGWSYYILRGIINILTPLERPLAPDVMTHGLAQLLSPSFVESHLYTQLGMFPSGHIGITTLAYLIIRRLAPRKISNIALGLYIFQCIAMIASRGHYTIDVLGAIWMAILLYQVTERYLKKRLTLK